MCRRWLLPLAPILGAAVFPGEFAAKAQSTVRKEIRLDAPHNVAAEAKFEYGHFVLIHRTGGREPGLGDVWVAVLNAEGKEVFAVSPGPLVPDTRMIRVADAAYDGRGLLVAAGEVWSTAGQAASVLLTFDTTARPPKTARIVRTSPVLCNRVTFDAKGTIWCAGPNLEKRQVLKQDDYEIVYRYSPAGQLLSRHLPRNLLPGKDLEALLNRGAGFPRLFPCGEGACFWAPGVNALLQFDQDGQLTSRLDVPLNRSGRFSSSVAATGDGVLFGVFPVGFDQPDAAGSLRYGVYSLDRLTGWKLESDQHGDSLTVGADGSELVTWNRRDRVFRWWSRGL